MTIVLKIQVTAYGKEYVKTVPVKSADQGVLKNL